MGRKPKFSTLLENYSTKPQTTKTAVKLVKSDPETAVKLRNALKVIPESRDSGFEAPDDAVMDNMALLNRCLDVHANAINGHPPLNHPIYTQINQEYGA